MIRVFCIRNNVMIWDRERIIDGISSIIRHSKCLNKRWVYWNRDVNNTYTPWPLYQGRSSDCSRRRNAVIPFAIIRTDHEMAFTPPRRLRDPYPTLSCLASQNQSTSLSALLPLVLLFSSPHPSSMPPLLPRPLARIGSFFGLSCYQ